MSRPEAPADQVDLAHEPDFQLGAMHVSPSTARVRLGDAEDRLEPRVMQVLVTLARAGGSTVTRDQLVDACWEGRIVSDDAIGRIIAKVRTLARSYDPAPFELDTLPKIGFRLRVLGEGEGEGEGEGLRPAGRRIRRRGLILAGLAIAAVALAAVFVWQVRKPVLPASHNGRVEVVAFQALHPEPLLLRLAASLDDAVMRSLARGGLATAPQVAQRGDAGSDAEFRITGTVDRRDDRVVAGLQLIDPGSGVILWSTRADRPVAEALDLEEELGFHAAQVLQCFLEDRQAYPAVFDAAALTAYFNGCEAMLLGQHHRALEFARRLVKLRPDLPGPHAVYAIGLAHIAWATDDTTEAEKLRQEARASAERALKIHPRYAEAYQALATTYPWSRDWAVRENYIRRVRELDSNFTPGHLVYIAILRETGRVREALAVANAAATAVDPRGAAGPRYETILLRAELEGAAAVEADIARLGDPGMARSLRRQVALWRLPPQEGRSALPALYGPQNPPAQRDCYDKHLAAVSQRTVVRGLPPECGRLAYDQRVRMLARQGDLDGAFAEASRPVPPTQHTTIHLFQPELKAFRADPRFMPFAHRLGLVDFWISTGRWPDFCADPDLPYDCRAVAARLSRREVGA